MPWPFLGSKALIIFEVFVARRVASMKELLTEANIMFIYVPGSCTSELQPLDKFINPYKTELKQCVIDWYASEVKKVLDNEKVHISLQTSTIKEPHANWIIKTQWDGKKVGHDYIRVWTDWNFRIFHWHCILYHWNVKYKFNSEAGSTEDKTLKQIAANIFLTATFDQIVSNSS